MTADEPNTPAADPPDDPRTRRRARFRAEAQDTAVEMFAAHGFDQVTMAEIAHALDVSERTLFRYFPSKEALLDPANDDLIDQLLRALEQRPVDETAFTALRGALRSVGHELDDERARFVAQIDLIHRHPALMAHMMHRQREIEEGLARVVASRASIDPDTDLRPALVAAAVSSALRVAVERWALGDADTDLATHLDESLELLARGLADL